MSRKKDRYAPPTPSGPWRIVGGRIDMKCPDCRQIESARLCVVWPGHHRADFRHYCSVLPAWVEFPWTSDTIEETG